MEQYDLRIARILAKIEALRDRKFKISVGRWPPVWEPPMTENAVSVFGAEKGIRLPEDYRRFLTTVSAKGSQPFYGLCSPAETDSVPERPFPYTLERFPYFLYMTEEEMDSFDYDSSGDGYLTLCTEGDGMDSILVVHSDDPEVYGTVWYFDFSNDCGAIPMRNGRPGGPSISWTGWSTGQTGLPLWRTTSISALLKPCSCLRRRTTPTSWGGRWDGSSKERPSWGVLFPQQEAAA